MTALSQDKRIWLAGGALAAVVIVAVGWLGVIHPKLSATNILRSDETAARSHNAVLEAKVAKLKRQNDNVGQLTASLRLALAALPSDSGLPEYTRQLSSQATAAKVTLNSISVGAVVPVSAAAATTPTTGTPAPTPTTTTAVATGTTVAISITLGSTGTARGQLAFLKAIQVTGPRRALVTAVNLGTGSVAGSSSSDVSSAMTTQLTVFSAPLTPAALAQLQALLATK